ncbi:hypothetical protein CPC08DRAFT_822594 [Agrocybe pediades]|nr:hypothetical protein CPC08DRAFT_822594 [Agrocybe pediades]
MTLSSGIYKIHSSKTHYATGTNIGDFVRALPPQEGDADQVWRVQSVEEEGDNVYVILPSVPKPGAFSIEGGVRPGGPISFEMPPAPFFITPKDDDKHVYVITPKGGPIGVRFAVVVEEIEGKPTLVVDPFPLDSDKSLPGWVFTPVEN